MLATAPPDAGRASIVAGMLTIHFAKRVGEVLCVHKYSGSMGPACYGISVFYSLLALLISVQTQHVPLSLYAAAGSQAALPIALAMFTVGQAGNLYHHWLLAQMRTTPESGAQQQVDATPGTSTAMEGVPPSTKALKVYSIPTGGLFDLVTTPHYLFEIIAWLGVALASQQLNAVLVAAGMASYLSGRAVASTRWYKGKFGDAYPSGRRHMVPFIF